MTSSAAMVSAREAGGEEMTATAGAQGMMGVRGEETTGGRAVSYVRIGRLDSCSTSTTTRSGHTLPHHPIGRPMLRAIVKQNGCSW